MTRRTRLRAMALLAPVLATAALAAPAAADHDHSGGSTASASAATWRDLARARLATIRYMSPQRAIADGYAPTTECVASPAGGMGMHYVNGPLVGDPAEAVTKPEVLLYESTPRGPRLIGVEYMKVDADQDLSTDDDRPSLYGVPFDGPMPGHSPGMPIHYDLHVWLWKHNPSGMFSQFNPRVRCT
jgi:hypothetical protein